jgi:putative transcriptional regulator
MPNLKDHYFQKSITYIIQHDVDGAVGLVVNKPTPRKFDDVFTVANLKTIKNFKPSR